MGIFFMPFVIGALVVFVLAIKTSIGLFSSEIIGLNEIGLGLLISLLLFAAITASYAIEGKIWGLSHFFRVPIFTMLIPFGIYLLLKNSATPGLNYFSKLLLLSIIFSGILSIGFDFVNIKILRYFNIEKHY